MYKIRIHLNYLERDMSYFYQFPELCLFVFSSKMNCCISYPLHVDLIIKNKRCIFLSSKAAVELVG